MLRRFIEARIVGVAPGAMTRRQLLSYFNLLIAPYEIGPLNWDDSGAWQLGTGRGIIHGKWRVRKKRKPFSGS
jgi:hypothetical protein